MARYKFILAYDGTAFYGSQRQADTRTVQGVVEAALAKLGWQDPSILLAGRTDTGVHASGQVGAFDLEWRHSTEDLRSALNSLLPTDTAVRSVAFAADAFHPRFDALSRTYRYQIYCAESRDPLRERYAWRLWSAPDFELLQAAASALVGVFDYANFGAPTKPGGSTIRQILKAEWSKADDQLTFEVTGNAFLYHMVRRMVNVLSEVGVGKRDLDEITEGLTASQERKMFQGLAPARGLTLVEVSYPDWNTVHK